MPLIFLVIFDCRAASQEKRLGISQSYRSSLALVGRRLDCRKRDRAPLIFVEKTADGEPHHVLERRGGR